MKNYPCEIFASVVFFIQAANLQPGTSVLSFSEKEVFLQD